MHDDQPHVSFRLTPELLAQVQTFAVRHDQSLSALCRDALHLVLTNPEPYLAMLSSRVQQHYRPPTPAQAEAAQRYLADAQAVDLSALYASLAPLPEPCTGDVRGVQIPDARDASGALRVRTPRDPAQRLYSARAVLHTAADVRRGGPERQSSRHAEHSALSEV